MDHEEHWTSLGEFSELVLPARQSLMDYCEAENRIEQIAALERGWDAVAKYALGRQAEAAQELARLKAK